MTDTEQAPAPAKAERWTAQWKELYDEVIDTGLCTGCAGCVIACPHDVIGYDHEAGGYKPFHLEDELGPDRLHPRREGLHQLHPGLPPLPRLGARGRRAPLRPGAPSPTSCRASTRTSCSPGPATTWSTSMGQDGGLVSAMLIWLREHDYIDGALVSFLEGDGRRLEGQARRRRHQRRDPGVGRQPLHLLGQHPGHRRGAGAGPLAASPSSA